MRKALFTMMCLATMLVAGTGLKAQEVTITLNPGWTWVSYPRADTMDVTTALQSIPPTDGDMIKMQDAFSVYMGGMWIGNVQQLIPGKGLMYLSMNPVTVSFVFGAEPGPVIGDHAYVDLGLPSGLLWATCNVGADSPEDYGDYFAWGETQPKDVYNWSTYQYCNGSYNTLTKYCNNSSYGYNGFTDNLTTLLPEDDAATANWGSDWRMPTKEECQELYQNTTVTWTTQNGVNGRLFTASNGNSLFLPAAGYRWDGVLYNAGLEGCYWSSSLYTDYPDNAWNLGFNSGYTYVSGSYRGDGISVRPIRSSGQSTSFIINATANPTEGGTVTGGGTYQEGQSCTVTATANTGYSFASWTENGSVVSTDATYSFTVEDDRVLVANFAVSSSGDHAYVDLGLPSGLLWATCNVGADSPEDYGDYFAWGETQPKDVYNWSTYQYANGTSWQNPQLTKYCNNSSYGYNGFTDNLTTLLPEDDAATANWGSDWRMPTKEEWQELYSNTTQTWTTQNGVNGRLFTASNGNSLFLPAAGGRWGGELGYAGSHGYYWSSSLLTDLPSYAWGLYFNLGHTDVIDYYSNRGDGFSVRPIRSSGQSTSFIINATANPAEGGEVSGGGTYQEGAECTLTATANSGYTFSSWTENGEVVSVDATYSFTVNANRTLAANFTTQIVYNFDFELGNIGFQSDYVFSPSGIINEGHYCVDNNTSNHGGGYGWPELIGSTGRFMLVNGFGGSANPNKVVWAPQQSIVVTPNTNYVFSCYVANLYQSFYGIIYPAKLQLKINGQDVGSLYNLPSDNDWHIWTVAWNSENATQADIQIVDCFTGNSGMGDDFALDNIAFVTEAENYTITITANLINGGMVSGGGTYEEGAECTLTATPNSGYTFTNWIENGEVVSTEATYTFTVTGNRDLVANFAVSGGGDHAYVDLGLPSGLLWATCNVGADNPEDYGDYFAWGETQPKDVYNWSTYQYCNGISITLTKYCNKSNYGYNGFTDNLTTLLPEDDAATANWGSDWRMPTKEELQELYNNTTVTWTTQNGVNGRLFTAANGYSLFLPAAGYRWDSELGCGGDCGDCWSSSLYTGSPSIAWDFYFDSGYCGVSNNYLRYFGHSVRAVRPASQN